MESQNIFPNNQYIDSNLFQANTQFLMGETIINTKLLDKPDSKIKEICIKNLNDFKISQRTEINIMQNNNNYNISRFPNKKEFYKNGKYINDIFIIYNYNNFKDKHLEKNGYIIENIDMNNETEFTYQNKLKKIKENNVEKSKGDKSKKNPEQFFSEIDKISICVSEYINPENKNEQIHQPSIPNNQQKNIINDPNQYSNSNNNNVNTDTNNNNNINESKVSEISNPTSISKNRTFIQSVTFKPPDRKPIENIIPQKSAETKINQPLPEMNVGGIDYSKIKTQEESKRILSKLLENNQTVNSKVIETNSVVNNPNLSVTNLNFPEIPTSKSYYKNI